MNRTIDKYYVRSFGFAAVVVDLGGYERKGVIKDFDDSALYLCRPEEFTNSKSQNLKIEFKNIIQIRKFSGTR